MNMELSNEMAATWEESHEGAETGSGVSVIVLSGAPEGYGPRLHQHPYPETFVIRGGQAMFTVGDRTLLGKAGQILVVPAYTPHRFEVIGPEPYEAIDIHENDTFVTEWLE